MAAIDALYPSPQERADCVWQQVSPLNLNVFDLLCFCLAFAANCSLGVGDPELQSHAVLALKRLHTIHYNNPTSLYSQDKPNEGDTT